MPACWFGSFRFGLPVSRPLSQARSLARRESFAPAGLPSRAPSPAAALWVGRVGFPPCRSAPSSRPLALLRRHSGLPLRGCFCPAVAGLVSFSPFRPPPASSLRCGCAPRFARKIRAPSRRSWCASPLPPFRGVGSAVGLSFVFISGVLAPLTRGWLSPLRFVAPSDDTSSCLRFVAPSSLSASRLRRFAVPCRAVCMYAGVLPVCAGAQHNQRKMGDYSSPIIKFSMYRDLFLNRWSLCHASRLNRIVTALWRLVEGRPAPSLFPPRLDFLHILFVYRVNNKWFVPLSQYLPISPCLGVVLKGLAVCAAIPLHVKFYFILHNFSF